MASRNGNGVIKKAHQKSAAPAHPKSLKRKREEEDLAALEEQVRALDVSTPITSFADLPLSKATAAGLAGSHFRTPTTIQQKAVPLALQGSDILGAAQTGSGKTLAFLVPLLEKLVRRNWTEHDGLGALVLSPTRELAIQIFEVLRKIGRYHTFSAGLVIGGKSLKEERERIWRMNILVCTPGRMLQHMDQTSVFEVDNLQILVLDEADRILDMGFQSTVDAIVEHLPKERQTLLFSATQTKKVSDLARLSLKDPEYVSVHESASSATPKTLQQHYLTTPLPEKLDTLWSFLRANVKAKILVFLSSGKQVRFVFESFRHLQPGLPLMHLHGRQKQTSRLDITNKYAASKNACLLATDVAARGLDFPAVDWVIQFDCPEDVDTYIHRVGRTARFEREGRAVLFLEPSEEVMVKQLEQKKVPIEEIKVKAKKQQSIKSQLQNMCFKDPELKYLGQKAFIAYVKSVHVQPNKEVFNLQKLPLEDFAASFGLPGAPRIKFQKGDDAKKLKNVSRQAQMALNEGDEGNNDGTQSKPVRTKYDRMFERQNQDVLSQHYTNLKDSSDDEDDKASIAAEDDTTFFNAKRRLSPASPSPTPPPRSTTPDPQKAPKDYDSHLALVIDSKRKQKALKSKKKLLKYRDYPTKLVFDDDGNPHQVYEFVNEAHFKAVGGAEEQRRAFVETETQRVREADVLDKNVAKEKKKAKAEKRKAREREEREAYEDGEERGAVLIPFEDDHEGLEEENGYSNVDSDGDERPASTVSADEVASGNQRGGKASLDDESSDRPQARKKRRKTAAIESHGSAREAEPETETLEDLERIWAGYL